LYLNEVLIFLERIEEWGLRHLIIFHCFRCRQFPPSSNSTHDEQLNSSPVRIRTGYPSRIRPFNQDSVPDRSRCLFIIVLINYYCGN